MLNSPIDEIKNRLDIVDVISSYVKLQKTGVNFRTNCPFHTEKKPSFFVSPNRQIWRCFGCGKGGNIFQFIMDIEGVEFGDALRILAAKAGVELKPINKVLKELKTERQRLYEICEFSCKFFEKQLNESKNGKKAKEYVLKRGVSEDSIKKWRIGYAPDLWQSLLDFLINKGYQKEEIEKAGLAVKKENYYDRFRGRIIFPIFDLNSQVIGFSGRVFKENNEEEIAKYINISNTLLYDKSKVLYGLDKAKLEIRRKNYCILVEGYIDTILCHQIGDDNTVAISGTALTSHQLNVLKRYSENLILCFDMDIAGDSAAKKGIDLAQTLGFNIKVITLANDSDPADVISQNPDEWKRNLENSKSIFEFYFETTFSKFDPKTIDGKKNISKIILPVIKKIPDHIEKSFWIQELAKRIEVKEEIVIEELKKIKSEEEGWYEESIKFKGEEILGIEPEEMVNQPKSRKELLEERLLVLLLKNPKNFDLNLIKKNDVCLFSPKTQEILKHFKNPKKILKQTNGLRDYFNSLCLKAEIEAEGIEEKDVLPEIQIILKEIQKLEIKNKLDLISQEIKKAEQEKDFGKVEKLIKEFHLISVKNDSFNN